MALSTPVACADCEREGHQLRDCRIRLIRSDTYNEKCSRELALAQAEVIAELPGVKALTTLPERPEVATNRISEGWQKFGWRGFSVITFCPGCMTPLLTEKQVLSVAKAFHSFNIEAIESVMQPIAAGFGIYIPGNEEIAQLTEHRVVVHPFCFTCSVHVGEPEFEERTERNIVLSRRLIERKRFKIRKAGA